MTAPTSKAGACVTCGHPRSDHCKASGCHHDSPDVPPCDCAAFVPGVKPVTDAELLRALRNLLCPNPRTFLAQLTPEGRHRLELVALGARASTLLGQCIYLFRKAGLSDDAIRGNVERAFLLLPQPAAPKSEEASS